MAGIARSYDGRSFAVQHISLDVRKGEFVTFLGPSGSGKTTTLTMIAGFELPDEGRILLAGRDLTELQPWRRNIGMVFQNYALFPHMTVARNVAFPLRMRGVSKDEIATRVKDVLALVDLATFAERHPRELSGGQQQRVALARGLVFNPDVLLLDEPLGALDKNLREQMQIEIKRIHREVGITMIYVTHDQTEAMTMSDRIAVFNAGRIEQVGSPLEIYARPTTCFVGSFVGESNFLSGKIIRNGGDVAIDVPELIKVPVVKEHAADLDDGTRVNILIRPENVLLRVGTGAGTPALPAIVERIVNYGDTNLVICRTGNIVFRVRVLGQELFGIRESAPAFLSWSPQHTHIIREQ